MDVKDRIQISHTRNYRYIEKEEDERSSSDSIFKFAFLFCYDADTMELVYKTDINFFGLEYTTHSPYADAVRLLQYAVTQLKERDAYTYIPHARQQAWVNNVMSFFTEFIELTNNALQDIVNRQRQWFPRNGINAEEVFNRGTYGFITERLQLIGDWMMYFRRSFDPISGAYTTFMED